MVEFTARSGKFEKQTQIPLRKRVSGTLSARAGVRLAIPSILAFTAVLCLTPGWTSAQRRPGIETSVNPPAGCYIADPVDTEDLYAFLRVEIQALAFARDGEKADRDLLAATDGPPVEKIAHLLAGLRKERIGNDCAGFVVSPYAKSQNEYIASIAAFLVHAYGELGKVTDKMLQLTLTETMRQKAGGSAEEELAQVKTKRLEILRYMSIALDASLALLLDARLDSNGKHDHLVFTAAQRDTLLRYLHSQFPSLKDNRADAGSGDFTEQVARIQSFLSGKYKPSDQ
jgi:hypothetical protein